MKKNEIKELFKKPGKELEVLSRAKNKELVEAKLKLKSNKLKNVHQVTKLRHDVARINTILKEKKL